MFKKIKEFFNKKAITRYFGGWELDAKDSEDLKNFIINHAVDKKGFDYFKIAQTALEMQVEENKIKEIISHSGSDPENIEIEVKAKDIDLPIANWTNNKVFILEKDPEGIHCIGGKKPQNFHLPIHKNIKTSLQYLGIISGKDKNFEWLEIDKLHICYPLFEYCEEGLFLDYSDQLNPKIHNPSTFKGHLYSDKNLGKWDDVYIKKTFFKTNNDPIPNSEDELNICGVPLWLQAPIYPKCPKTGELMKFVCTISSDRDLILLGDKKIAKEFNNLIFGDYGYLYIFFHPKSRMMYLEWQST